MNQLETNLAIWAICSIILFEILFIICICRCCFNRIKPKRFYVKREEYEYLQGNDGLPSQFQSTILRPPHADELAVVGTIRDQNPILNYDNGIPNYGFYRDDDDNTDDVIPPVSSLTTLPPTTSSSQHVNWIELRTPPSTTGMIHTGQLPTADYEIRSYPTDDYIYTHQSPVPRPTIIDFRHFPDEYDHDRQHFQDQNDDEDELDNFRFHPFHRPEVIRTHIQRTDTSTESFPGNYATIVPKSILKSSSSTTPPPMDIYPISYPQPDRSRTPSKYDESPRMSVKINTDESIPLDYPTSAIEKIIPNQPLISSTIPTLTKRMRFASVSQLNDIEWEVPREFQTIVYSPNNDRQPYTSILMYNSNENFNNNNNSYTNDNSKPSTTKLSTRQRSKSAFADQRTHVSRIFVPWDHQKKIIQPFYLTNDIEQENTTQQQAFEY